MVIDAHYHPAFIKEVCGNEELAQRRRNDMAYYKTGVAEVKRCLLYTSDAADE